jgi:hypothetical protein
MAELQRHHGHHALREIADRRLHQRIGRQLRIGAQLGNMLVLERQPVGQELGRILALGFRSPRSSAGRRR